MSSKEIEPVIDEKPRTKEVKIKKRLMSTSDTIFSLLIVCPLVLCFWRGSWGLMDKYPDLFPGLYTFVIGCSIHTFFALIRDKLNELLTIQKSQRTILHKMKSQIIRRCYTYMFTISCIMQWRGGWIVLDELCKVNRFYTVYASLALGLMLIALKSFRNLVATPLVIFLDDEHLIFGFPTRYRAKTSEKLSLYILDCLFSVFVIGTLVVFVWRGAWVLFDIFLFPEDLVWSSWVSLILGYSIVAMAFSMQPAMRWLCGRLNGIPRIIVADIFLFFSVIGTINVWRGIWNLLDHYFLPDHPEISCWTTHCVGLVLLILLNCANSLLVRGVYIDAEEPDGKCVVFPIYYLRLMFKNERIKKRNRKLQFDLMSKRKQDADYLKVKNDNCNSEQNHVLLIHPTTIDLNY